MSPEPACKLTHFVNVNFYTSLMKANEKTVIKRDFSIRKAYIYINTYTGFECKYAKMCTFYMLLLNLIMILYLYFFYACFLTI